MSFSRFRLLSVPWLGVCAIAVAQTAPGTINMNSIKQLLDRTSPATLRSMKNAVLGGGGTGAGGGAPRAGSGQAGLTSDPSLNGGPQVDTEEQKADRELADLKAKDVGPHRFAQDLFTFRDHTDPGTDGGIADDYVLQTGDALSLLMTGDLDSQQDVEVDGRGAVAIPSVGNVAVAGQDLGQARRTIQTAVRRKYSQTEVAVKVSRLREVRVFILGETYRPGSYLVPSLSSIVNVLSLAGGPDALGSYRTVKVLRGGRTLQTVDLYALRDQGTGNFNLTFQNGDTVFVPLAGPTVLLEGAFTRVVGLAELPPDPYAIPDDWTRQRARLLRQIQSLEQQLQGPPPGSQDPSAPPPVGLPAPGGSAPLGLPPTAASPGPSSGATPGAAGAAGAAASLAGAPMQGAPVLTADQKAVLENQLDGLYQQMATYRSPRRGDHRLRFPDQIRPDPQENSFQDQPWVQQWLDQDLAPRLQFELLPGETAADTVRFAGGCMQNAYQDTLSLRRRAPGGLTKVISLSMTDPGVLKATRLQSGDLLSALPSRESLLQAVTVRGWVRASGRFARDPHQGVGDLLKRDHQLLSDTFLGRGEILRTGPDGKQSYLTFQVAKAIAGDPAENLPLEDRDQVELYRAHDFVQDRLVTVTGPMTRPGDFPYYPGMRAADLLFRAGSPLRSANEVGGELARFKDGKVSQVVPLDLSRLLTSDQQSPDLLRDDPANPLLEPDDRISIFEKPNFRVHRTVTLMGEVGRPGSYVLDDPRLTLSQLLQRAGGLTPEAMPRAGYYLRNPAALEPALGQDGNGQPVAGQAGGYPQGGSPQSGSPQGGGLQGGNAQSGNAQSGNAPGSGLMDPTAMGINEILSRLAETKRQPLTGELQVTPLLHGLVANHINRLVVDFENAVKGAPDADVELQDGDTIIIPRQTDAVYVVGETVSPFGVYKAHDGLTVGKLIDQAGGTTRNADNRNIRLLKCNGQIIDHHVKGQGVEPGDVVLIPQKIRKDFGWQENLSALMPLALIYNAIKR